MLLVRVITEFVRVCTFTCRSVTGFLGSNPVFSPGNLMITTVVSTVATTIATQSVPYCFAQQFLRRRLLLLFYRLQLGSLWVHIWVRDSSQSLWSWLKNSPFEVCGNAGINARDMAEGGGRNYKEHNCLAKTSFSSGDWYPSMALMLRHNGGLPSKAYPTMELQCTRGSNPVFSW